MLETTQDLFGHFFKAKNRSPGSRAYGWFPPKIGGFNLSLPIHGT